MHLQLLGNAISIKNPLTPLLFNINGYLETRPSVPRPNVQMGRAVQAA